jgi:hypothetical protein
LKASASVASSSENHARRMCWHHPAFKTHNNSILANRL